MSKLKKRRKPEQTRFTLVRGVGGNTIHIDGLRIISEVNVKCHWAVKASRVKSHREASRAAMQEVFATPDALLASLPIAVVMTRIAPRSLDSDNLFIGFKACRDGIADFLGVNDGDRIVTWVAAQRRGGCKEYGVEFTFQTLAEYTQQTVEATERYLLERASAAAG